jgi:hypothetical protein
VPAEPTPEFFVAAERAVAHSIPKPVALVVCYPSNPTAYVASLDFYRDLVAFAKNHDLILLSDLAYSEVYFDEPNPPPSMATIMCASHLWRMSNGSARSRATSASSSTPPNACRGQNFAPGAKNQREERKERKRRSSRSL